MGGSDTVENAIVWTMTWLMKKPLVMKKLQEEIRRLGGKKDMIDNQDIEKLPYLRAVIKEAFRLWNYGVYQCLGYWARSCRVGNADEFLPERFLEGQNPELVTFGFGRRGCPGMGMTMAEVELVMANLVYKFNWELPVGMKEEDIDFECKPGAALHKKNDLCLVATVVI
ncbi:hypothetical protein SASPL_128383 [Salvia splendens]|uniref:Uncharacterized protein n=1 Tax=Salvia splendens TaxID=180675 RepID=A0A8X8X9E5_SALSN|nr:hypothetical protein SASPL_128383 [Salvia splendens]